MRRPIMFASLMLSAVALLGACTQTAENKPGTTVTPASPLAGSPSPGATTSPADDKKGSAKTDALVGEWLGLEGTSLKVEKENGNYEIEIKTKDGSKEFEGTAKGDVIEFTRNGKTETIRAATAEETGMKWVQGEKNCIVITKGSEAFCRK